MLRRRCLCFPVLALVALESARLPAAETSGWKAGTATVKVTPTESMWMAGYAARKKPSEGVASDLFCKALALEDAAGKRFVFVTCDLIGIPRGLREGLEQDVAKTFQMPPEALLLNASHTHCGPEFRVTSSSIEGDGERQMQARRYGDELRTKIVDLIGRAFAVGAPAKLEYVKARCGFAMNRRTPSENGYKNSPWSEGPVDHDVPVLKVSGDDGALRAVLFGYACHNTTLSFFQFCGDYAGFAQQYIEEKHPGTTALFFMGCGGDQNPYPRREIEFCRQHGRSLATAVQAALEAAPVRELKPTLASALRRVTLEFAPPPPREVLERDAQASSPTVANHARRLLKQLEENGKIETLYDAPVQMVRLGDLLTIVAFPGETVVDYSLTTKQKLAADGIVWVAGYSNDVFGYIPSKRVLLEGGYEAGGAFLFGSFPGPFAADVEERLMKTIDALRADLQGR